ncbi:MAG TPA: hypothetical protein VN958_19470 [Chitinophagaceae bacterium]|nr:hypothetical protein [Chitinophagaceae bacterium]
MKKQFNKTTSAVALSFAVILLLNLMGCKKEAVTSSASQSRLNSSTQTNAAMVYISNEKVLTDILVNIPCANGGAGEDVELSGYLHATNKVTVNGNRVHVKYHYQPQGITGVGSVTGDKYQATGVTQDEYGGSLVNGQYEETYINNFRIIGQGNGNNYLVHVTFHGTINANGVVTTVIENATSDCK